MRPHGHALGRGAALLHLDLGVRQAGVDLTQEADLGRADLKELTMSGPGIYLEKPVKPENYIAAIKRVLNLDATEEEARLGEKVKLQSEVKDLIDESDVEMLKRIRELMKEK
jgi:DNA-binding NtrC family response regulator